VYLVGNQARVLNLSLASFFNYFTQTLFDPRVVFDKVWRKWVVTAEAFPESSSTQYQFIAISRNENPTTGSWTIWRIDVNPGTSSSYLWDFPQVGLDQDSVIITANIFDPGYVETRMFAVAKALLYNGIGWSVPFYSGLLGTLSPPIVLDQNRNTYLLAAPAYVSPGGTTIRKYTLTNSAYSFGQTLTFANITVPAYFIPPDARQPGTTATLDSLDCRFGNWSTQLGNRIWNAHSISFGTGTYAWAKWYEFDAVANTVANSGFMGAINGSDDWMPHVTVNDIGDVFGVWSQSDGLSSVPLRQRMCIGGRQAGDATTSLGICTQVIQSPTVYTNFRWGDYQAVDVNAGPNWGNRKTAFAIGEYVTGSNFWNSRIARMLMP
jgi:hypothetical protein